MKTLTIIVLSFVVAVLTGCANVPMSAQNSNPNVYAPRQAMAAGRVIDGMVTGVRRVTIESSNNATVGGGAIGAVVGNLLAHKGTHTARVASMLVGGLAGALAGNHVGKSEADEVVVQMADGYRRVIVQQPGDAPRRVGQRVLVLINGDEARIIER